MKKLSALVLVAVAAFAGLAQAADPVLDDYVQVSSALVKDDLPAAQKAASGLAQAATTAGQSALADDAQKIAASTSLDAARSAFGQASAEAVKLAAGKEGYYIFTCPMAGADWVQKSTSTQNPYMGQSMPTCGFQKTASPAPAAKAAGCCG